MKTDEKIDQHYHSLFSINSQLVVESGYQANKMKALITGYRNTHTIET